MKTCKYLTADELAVINEVVVSKSGGSIGLRDFGLLQSVSVKPQTSFGGQDIYPDLHLKAAVLYEAIVNYHVFVDGNKRTAFAALARFLYINGYNLSVTTIEIVDYTVGVAVNNPDLADIAVWIKAHSKKLK